MSITIDNIITHNISGIMEQISGEIKNKKPGETFTVSALFDDNLWPKIDLPIREQLGRIVISEAKTTLNNLVTILNKDDLNRQKYRKI